MEKNKQKKFTISPLYEIRCGNSTIKSIIDLPCERIILRRQNDDFIVSMIKYLNSGLASTVFRCSFCETEQTWFYLVKVFFWSNKQHTKHCAVIISFESGYVHIVVFRFLLDWSGSSGRVISFLSRPRWYRILSIHRTNLPVSFL